MTFSEFCGLAMDFNAEGDFSRENNEGPSLKVAVISLYL